jgi:uncharacterized protein (DUF4415 family)
MSKRKLDTEQPWTDIDDAPELDDAFFATAKISRGETVLRDAQSTFAKRGRPKSDDPKQLVSLRLDRVVLDRLRSEGPGWQSRINELLRKSVGV